LYGIIVEHIKSVGSYTLFQPVIFTSPCRELVKAIIEVSTKEPVLPVPIFILIGEPIRIKAFSALYRFNYCLISFFPLYATN